MEIVMIILILIIIGVLWYLLNKYVPMPEAMTTIINVVIIIAVVYWLLSLFFPVLLHWSV